jgi:hypothetical protein
MVTRCSNGAAATLEYACLRDPPIQQVVHEIVARLCQASASRAHAHLYVVACIEYQQGKFKDYSRRLSLSVQPNFPPAIGDVDRALIEFVGQMSQVHFLRLRRSRTRNCAGTQVFRTTCFKSAPRIEYHYFPNLRQHSSSVRFRSYSLIN